MKLKMEEKVVPELTGADNYRAWKQGVQVLLDIYELNYLLTAPEPISITPTTPEQQAEGSGSGGALNVSSAPKGKGKSGDEEEVIQRRDGRERANNWYHNSPSEHLHYISPHS